MSENTVYYLDINTVLYLRNNINLILILCLYTVFSDFWHFQYFQCL